MTHQADYQTDPAWADKMGLGGAKRDGRHARATRTKAAILLACQQLMQAGDFRPTMTACCARVPCSIRSGFEHFPNVEALHLAALDVVTRGQILDAAFGSNAWERALDYDRAAELRLVHAIVLGTV